MVHGEERKDARDGRTYGACGTPVGHHVETAVVRGRTTGGESSVGWRAEEEERLCEAALDHGGANRGTRVHGGCVGVRAFTRDG